MKNYCVRHWISLFESVVCFSLSLKLCLSISLSLLKKNGANLYCMPHQIYMFESIHLSLSASFFPHPYPCNCAAAVGFVAVMVLRILQLLFIASLLLLIFAVDVV